MSVMRWDPWHELANLQRDVSELFGRTSGMPMARAATIPPMDIYRTDEGIVMVLELPGATADDVDITVEDGVLTISGERKALEGVEADQWVRRERPTGSFTRSLALPEGVDADQISAEFRDGLLQLRVPHPPESKPRRVQISTGSAGSETIDVTERGRGETAQAGAQAGQGA